MHLFSPGHSGCPGCGPSNALIQIVDTLGKDIIVVNATGCMEITSSQYPQTAWRVPYIHSLFENAASVASGVAAALKAQGNDHTKVVVIGGDGSTYDIGFGALSGMLERRDNVLYVCYDNQLYANTGVQKSGATPYGAATTTTVVGSVHKGKETERKPIVEIAAAHGIAYAASTSIAYYADMKMKLLKAKAIKGPAFVTIDAPCCLGAGFDGGVTFKVAKLAVQSRLWYLFEIENGKYKLNFNPSNPKPVKEYLVLQKRFKHLDEKQIKHIQQQTDITYEDLLEKSGLVPKKEESK
ncbi:MAG: 2-ketoisovalerate ferredoxin oxidoreductase [Candidatus Diapherotrites archaeon]|uniref:2-ketoisovalerate ferredoxin oxidoreductase n=1 Tax=Candidatus Iainarchaeum sp. TaxID=3101447 RepID=A0A2D6LNV0_9ARCH|nr:2-ketoisovalerate ferredoxin oxidoreductase [Candidatus Diapherotrites archaeon]